MTPGRRDFLAALAATMVPAALAAQGLEVRPPRKPPPDPRALLAASGLAGQVGYALSSDAGPLALGRAAQAMAPASTMKAITALFALDRLGPDRRFRTQVIRSGDMLILAGAGDPVLSTDDLAVLAATVAQTGQPPPARFAVWGGALPGLAQIAPEQAVHLAYNPSISGMMLNFNRVHLDWTRPGAEYRTRVEARAGRLSPPAYTIAALPGDHPEIFSYRHDLEREYWSISRAAMGRSGSRWLPVRLPELYAADVFQTLCRAQGLVLPPPEVLDRLPAGRVMAHHDSPPVLTLIRDMLRYSTNITAEALGLHASAAADFGGSAEAMRRWLGETGQGMQLADHSGLSEASRLSPFAMTRVLAGPGRDLNLRPLLRENPLSQDQGRSATSRPQVAAKTGTLNFVSNLAGYVTTPSGAEGVFAVFCTDSDRRDAAIGQELPAGVSTWTRGAKALQARLIAGFAARLDAEV